MSSFDDIWKEVSGGVAAINKTSAKKIWDKSEEEATNHNFEYAWQEGFDVANTKDLNTLVQEIHNTAKEKGWWKDRRTSLEIHALIMSEIAEAVEEVREEKPSYYEIDGKPCGESTEIADIIIRCLDYVGYRGWDINKIIEAKMAYNKTRPYKHNKKY